MPKGNPGISHRKGGGRRTSNEMKYIKKWMQKKYNHLIKNNGQPNARAKGKIFVLTYQGQTLQISTYMGRGSLRWRTSKKVTARQGGGPGGLLVESFIRFYANDPDYKKFFYQKNGAPKKLAEEYTFDYRHNGEDLKMVAKVLKGKAHTVHSGTRRLVWVRDSTEKRKELDDRYAVEKQDRRAQTMMDVTEGDTGDRRATFHASTHHVAIENDKYLEPNVAHPGGIFNGHTNSSDIPKVFLGT